MASRADRKRRKINDEYLDQLKNTSEDSSDVAKLRLKIRSICKDWIDDKRMAIEIKKLKDDLATKKKYNEKYKDMLLKLNVNEELLKTPDE